MVHVCVRTISGDGYPQYEIISKTFGGDSKYLFLTEVFFFFLWKTRQTAFSLPWKENAYSEGG